MCFFSDDKVIDFCSVGTDAYGTRCVFFVTIKCFVFVRLEPMCTGYDFFFFFFGSVGTDAYETRCVFFAIKKCL